MSSAFPAAPVLWPFDVDWTSKPYTVGYNFKTTISTSRSGIEQRRALRAKPRKTLDFDCVIDGDRVNQFRRLMAQRQALPLVLPELTRGAFAGTLTGGVAPLTVAPWMQVGVNVVVALGARREVGMIGAIGAGSVTITGITGDWAAGASVCPALACYLDAPSTTPLTSNAMQASLRFNVIPGSSSMIETETADVQFDGRDYFGTQPNWSNEISEDYLWPSETVDYERGRVAVFHPIDFGTIQRSATFLQGTRGEAEALLSFFLRQRGQRGSFYAPLWGPDLVLGADADAASAQITVAGADVAADFAGSSVFRAIEIRLISGALIRRRVVLITAVGASSVVGLDAPLGQAITAAQISRISWLPLCRFGSDEMAIEWQTNTVAQTKLAITTIPNVDFDGVVLRAIPQGDTRAVAGSGDDRGVAR